MHTKKPNHGQNATAESDRCLIATPGSSFFPDLIVHRPDFGGGRRFSRSLTRGPPASGRRELVQILGTDACVARDSKRQPWLQILVPVHRNRNYFALAGLGIDMVTPIDASQCPAVRLNQSAHL